VAKRHLDLFQKRVTRYLKRFGITGWGCLWFLEFQTRGAPHFHLLFFGLKGTRNCFPLALFMKWLSSAWAEIVGHSDSFEYQKHLNAGTKAEIYRSQHFGYALKYASKLEQKSVPAEFSDIGRFWGCWNSPLGAPVVRSLYTASNALRTIGEALYQRLFKYSPRYATKLFNELSSASEGAVLSRRAFGSESADYLLSYGKPAG
jgi:hypothetical protein